MVSLSMAQFQPGTRVLVASSGSRGDCQPFVALGLGLKSAGCEVVVFTNPDHRELVEQQGLSFTSNTLWFKEFFGSEEVAKANTRNDFLAFLDGIGKLNSAGAAQQYETYYEAIRAFKPDLIVAGTQHWSDAVTIPLLLRVPTLPFNLSNSHTVDPYQAPFGLPSLPFGANGLLWRLVFSKWVRGVRASYGGALRKLSGRPLSDFFPTTDEVLAIFGGMQPDPFPFVPYLVAQDETFVGHKSTDVGRLVYTGNLTLPSTACKGSEFGGDATQQLEAFLECCPEPPVYIGWGSVTVCTPKWMTLMAVRSLKLAGCRGVVLGGWSGMRVEHLEGEKDSEELKLFCGANVFFTSTAAHEVLFPKCSVIVHHGGIGTTTVGVKSGRPNVVTPILYDQFDSAKLVEQVGQGVGAGHLPTLSPEDLAGHIRTCLTDMQKMKSAAALGERMRQRDGVQEATRAIAAFLSDVVQSGEYWKGMDEFAARKKFKARGAWTRVVGFCSGVTSVAERRARGKVPDRAVLLGRRPSVSSDGK